MRIHVFVVILTLLLVGSGTAQAQTAAFEAPGLKALPQAPGTPRAQTAGFNTCLVLSGGGARGMAHIGVIKVLER